MGHRERGGRGRRGVGRTLPRCEFYIRVQKPRHFSNRVPAVAARAPRRSSGRCRAPFPWTGLHQSRRVRRGRRRRRRADRWTPRGGATAGLGVVAAGRRRPKEATRVIARAELKESVRRTPLARCSPGREMAAGMAGAGTAAERPGAARAAGVAAYNQRIRSGKGPKTKKADQNPNLHSTL